METRFRIWACLWGDTSCYGFESWDLLVYGRSGIRNCCSCLIYVSRSWGRQVMLKLSLDEAYDWESNREATLVYLGSRREILNLIHMQHFYKKALYSQKSTLALRNLNTASKLLSP